MRSLLIALTGFLAGIGLVLALVLPVSLTSAATSKRTGATAASMPHMNGGMGSMSSGSMASTSTAARKLTIQHVQKGCHVWSNGNRTGVRMHMRLRLGQKLSILDQDVDAHRMIELAGPTRMHMGRPMMSGHAMTLVFTTKGVYHLGTKTVEMKGMNGGMDVKTIGPDNKLRLTVTVV